MNSAPLNSLAKPAFCADLDSSTDEYANRFSGPLGTWLLSVQQEGIIRLLGELQDRSVLDLGGGHAQLAAPLSAAGAKVTVIGSQQICAKRLQAWLSSGQGEFVVGDLLKTPFADRQFDFVVSVRMISHCEEWPRLVSELCRVAKVAVLIDYPPIISFNLFYGALFFLKRGLEGNTRTFLIFREKELKAEFAKHGFVPERQYKQFFFPMVLHRMLKTPLISKALEGFCRCIGLTALFGSPTLLKMVRVENQSQ